MKAIAIALWRNLVLVCAFFVSVTFVARGEEPLPKGVQGVTVKERLGNHINLNLPFVDHTGKEVFLKDFVEDGRPVLLTLNYYKCAMLCSLQLNALVEGLKKLDWDAVKGFRIVTVSIDPRNPPELAQMKRTQYLDSLGRGEVDWTFLVGKEAQIQELAASVGFEYKYDPVEDQYAHGLAIFFIGAGGKVSRYLYGLDYPSRDLKFALLDTAEGKMGSPVDKFIMNCFHYDETRGRYGPAAVKIMQAGGLVTISILGLGLSVLWRREKIRRA